MGRDLQYIPYIRLNARTARISGTVPGWRAAASILVTPVALKLFPNARRACAYMWLKLVPEYEWIRDPRWGLRVETNRWNDQLLPRYRDVVDSWLAGKSRKGRRAAAAKGRRR